MSKIEQQVLASVAVIYAARKLTSAFAFKVYGLVVSALGIAAFVSLSNVMANFASVADGGLANIVTFVVSAVLGTTLVVQLALALAAFASGSLVVDVARLFTQSSKRFA